MKKMKVVLPLFYFPPISWFKEFLKSDNEVVLEQFEHFPKQTYRNRTNIYAANGKLSLIIPTQHKGKQAMKDVEIDDNAFKGVEAIIHSMTKKERQNPNIIDNSRKKRIAAGSGTTLQEVNQLLKQFSEMGKMMKFMNSANGKKMMETMSKNMPAGGFPGMPKM